MITKKISQSIKTLVPLSVLNGPNDIAWENVNTEINESTGERNKENV